MFKGTRKSSVAIVVVAIVLAVVAQASDVRKPSATITDDLPKALARAREMIGYQQAKNRKRLVESDIVEHLISHPGDLSLQDEELYKLFAKNKADIDPKKHVRLVPPPGESGYQDFQIYFNHAREGREVADLRKVWTEFLSQAKIEIALNVFEFDLMSVAEVLAMKAKAGVNIRVGIDEKRIERNPGVAKVVDFLRANKVQVIPVESSYLNHQKVAAIDWSDPKLARVLFSSGNLTQSCLGPEGDLKDFNPRPAFSIPNANHVVTMKSWLASQLVNHELTKTFDPILKLKGSTYPTVGTYQITGPGVPPSTLEAYPSPSFIITFTPGGGYRSVSQNLLVDLIERTEGPVRILHFAFSNKPLTAALLVRAQREIARAGTFDFLLVGDTPSLMQKWSMPLLMSGYKRLPKEKKGDDTEPGNFDFDFESPWVTSLGDKAMEQLRPKIRIAPPHYSTRHWMPPGAKSANDEMTVNAKIHHKLLTSGEFAVVGSSFNFSERAEKNHEQILIFHDKKIVDEADRAVRGLAKESLRSVSEDVERRMQIHSRWKQNKEKRERDDVEEDEDAGSAKSNSKSST